MEAELQGQLQIISNLSITEKFNSAAGMVYLLMLSGARPRERNRIIDDGFNAISTLLLHYENDVEGFETYLTNLNKTFATATAVNQRVYLSPPIIKSLVGSLHYYMEAVKVFHQIPDLSSLDAYTINNACKLYKARKSNEDDDEAKPPVDITLKGHTNYVKWRDNFSHMLSQTIGNRGFAIDYIIDDTPRDATHGNNALIEVDTIDLNQENIYKQRTTQFGNPYIADNKRVWDILKANLLGSPPYNHIAHLERSKNGRAAWQALRDFYEGIDFQETLRAEAFKDIKNAFYSGETSRFNFERYVEIHQEAHTKLLEAGYNGGRGMDEETKVQHFEEGIRSNADLEVALASIRANRATYRNFTRLVTYLKSEVDAKQRRKSTLKQTNSTRRVASAKRSNNNGQGKGGYNNNKNKDVPSRFVDGKQVYGKHYPHHIFRSLTKAQKAAITQMRKNSTNNNDSNHSETKSIAALTAKIDDITDNMSTMEDRIIAGVSRASTEDDDHPDDITTRSSNSKRSAKSGGVGGYIAKQKKSKHDQH